MTALQTSMEYMNKTIKLLDKKLTIATKEINLSNCDIVKEFKYENVNI